VRASGKPVFDADGRWFRGYRGTGTDVTALMHAREEHERLRQLESDLAHMNRLKHDGRTGPPRWLTKSREPDLATGAQTMPVRHALLGPKPTRPGPVREALTCVVDDDDRAGEILDVSGITSQSSSAKGSVLILTRRSLIVIALAQGAINQKWSLRPNPPYGGTCLMFRRIVSKSSRSFLNLILNAVEAMSLVKKGVRELAIITEQQNAGGVLVAVRDSGPGIDYKTF